MASGTPRRQSVWRWSAHNPVPSAMATSLFRREFSRKMPQCNTSAIRGTCWSALLSAVAQIKPSGKGTTQLVKGVAKCHQQRCMAVSLVTKFSSLGPPSSMTVTTALKRHSSASSLADGTRILQHVPQKQCQQRQSHLLPPVPPLCHRRHSVAPFRAQPTASCSASKGSELMHQLSLAVTKVTLSVDLRLWCAGPRVPGILQRCQLALHLPLGSSSSVSVLLCSPLLSSVASGSSTLCAGSDEARLLLVPTGDRFESRDRMMPCPMMRWPGWESRFLSRAYNLQP